MAEKHLVLTIYGKVKGVFFRARSAEKAKGLGLRGFVCNRPEGSVYLEAEGEEEDLKELLAWCEVGPSQAVVEKIESVWQDKLVGFSDFVVRYEHERP